MIANLEQATCTPAVIYQVPQRLDSNSQPHRALNYLQSLQYMVFSLLKGRFIISLSDLISGMPQTFHPQ